MAATGPARARSSGRLRQLSAHLYIEISRAHAAHDAAAAQRACSSAAGPQHGPQRVPVGDTATVHAALAADGVVVLTGLGEEAAAGDAGWGAAAQQLPARVFGGRLLPGTSTMVGSEPLLLAPYSPLPLARTPKWGGGGCGRRAAAAVA